MIEKIVQDYLISLLPVPVVLEIPANPPAQFVVLHKGGSDREDLLDNAMIVADSYSPSLFQAAELNEAVKAAMDDLTDLPRISASRLQNDYLATDTRIERYRYQAVYDVTHY